MVILSLVTYWSDFPDCERAGIHWGKGLCSKAKVVAFQPLKATNLAKDAKVKKRPYIELRMRGGARHEDKACRADMWCERVTEGGVGV